MISKHVCSEKIKNISRIYTIFQRIQKTNNKKLMLPLLFQTSNSSITLPHPASSASTRPSLTDCIARIQELERENEALKMERARLEASYRNAETRRFEEQHAEILHLKVCVFLMGSMKLS